MNLQTFLFLLGNTSNLFWHYLSLSLLCVKLFKDGVLQTEIGDKDDPRLSKMRKEVVAGGKDTMEVDNDFFLVPVKISDHQVFLFFPTCCIV